MILNGNGCILNVTFGTVESTVDRRLDAFWQFVLKDLCMCNGDVQDEVIRLWPVRSRLSHFFSYYAPLTLRPPSLSAL